MNHIVLYLKCTVGALLTVVLVFCVILLAEVVAVEMVGFGVGFRSPIAWLVLALAVFGAGFFRERHRELRRLAKYLRHNAETPPTA